MEIEAYIKENHFSNYPEKKRIEEERNETRAADIEEKSAKKMMDPAKFAIIKNKYPLLASIASFDPTDGGKIENPYWDTYTSRILQNLPVPPSAIDCFTCDLRLLYRVYKDFNLGELSEELGNDKMSRSLAMKLIQVYKKVEYNNIPGYKGGTFYVFVNKLSDSQVEQLAGEVEEYVKEYGFLEK